MMQTADMARFVMVPFSSEAILRTRDKRLWGSIDNLSTGRAFITISENIELGAELEMEIFLAEPASQLSVVLDARVVRLTCTGVAVQFTGMPSDMFDGIRNAVATSLG